MDDFDVLSWAERVLLEGESLRHEGRYPRSVIQGALTDVVIATGVFALSLVLLAAGGRDAETDVRGFHALGVVLAALGAFCSSPAGERDSPCSRSPRRRASP